MKLDAYMTANDLDDEAMAQKVRDTGCACDRSTINRLRNGKQWMSKDLAVALPKASGGDVTANDFVPEDLSQSEAVACNQ